MAYIVPIRAFIQFGNEDLHVVQKTHRTIFTELKVILDGKRWGMRERGVITAMDHSFAFKVLRPLQYCFIIDVFFVKHVPMASVVLAHY